MLIQSQYNTILKQLKGLKFNTLTISNVAEEIMKTLIHLWQKYEVIQHPCKKKTDRFYKYTQIL